MSEQDVIYLLNQVLSELRVVKSLIAASENNLKRELTDLERKVDFIKVHMP